MSPHDEDHSSHRIGLLRAMVLGANDGIISTACLVLGVAAATAERSTIPRLTNLSCPIPPDSVTNSLGTSRMYPCPFRKAK